MRGDNFEERDTENARANANANACHAERARDLARSAPMK